MDCWRRQPRRIRAGAYDFEWLEQSVTERREDWPYPDGFFGVADPPSARIPWQDWAFAKKKHLSLPRCSPGRRKITSCSSTRATRGTGRWS